jgi:riboflavin kinase / FMN adenylyltransferase
MRILRHHRSIPDVARGAVVALGNFDGVHRGHRALIGEAARLARESKRPLAALVFEPYPREFLRPGDPPFRLTTFRTKAHLLSKLGVDFLIVLGFDAAMASMPAQDFVIDVLVGALGVGQVVVGADFRFGKGRAGDTSVLSYMGMMEGFGVTVVTPLVANGEKISSSQIRAALRTGKPEEAARLLGHWWSVEGHVAPGDERGRTIGYPTANLKLEQLLQPAFGVYAVKARIGASGGLRGGVANFGIRPTFRVSQPLMEVHLFDFVGELYGEMMAVELIAYLRGERKFEGLDALKAQIAADSNEARRILAATAPGRVL